MTAPRNFLAVLGVVAAAGLLVAGGLLAAPPPAAGADGAGSANIRQAIVVARVQAAAAARRGARLEASARAATEAADRTAREAAALAARIQQSEARIAAAEGRMALIASQQRVLQQRLAQRREPLVRLTAALQRFARRPLGLSVLRPGSLRETVYLRAMLETTLPQVRRRTAALREEIDRGQRLELSARNAVAALRMEQQTLAERRSRLAALETSQRLASRRRSGEAARESERALALAEDARDLGTLVARLGEAGSLRAALAALPGPVLRPAAPSAARVVAVPSPAATGPDRAPPGLQLPVAGRTVAGFGTMLDGGVRSAGIGLAPRPGALVVAPAAGRIAFAAPYRGFGRIVIIDHGGGWTSLVTGLARIDAEVGEQVLAGAPLGVAAPVRPVIAFELRRGNTPVNPLDFIG